MLDLPEQLGPLRTMQAAATDQGSRNPPRITALPLSLQPAAEPDDRRSRRVTCDSTATHRPDSGSDAMQRSARRPADRLTARSWGGLRARGGVMTGLPLDAGDRPHGRRLRTVIVVLWRAGLRIHEALAV